jgi:hypothetical protein
MDILVAIKKDINKQSLIALGLAILIWGLLHFIIGWIFNDEFLYKSQNKCNCKDKCKCRNNDYDDDSPSSYSSNKGNEVFNVKNNSNWSNSAQVCSRYGARLATIDEMRDAQKNGANWCSLGWLSDQSAFYPTQQKQVDMAANWPLQFRNGCGQVGINGGIYPIDLQLSVNCYGMKPSDFNNINPWDTINYQWSKYK